MKKKMDRKELFDFLVYLFLIYLISCFVGWLYEEIFYWITESMLRNRGILYGPWLPIYGVGAMVIYLAKPLKKWPPVLFLVCMVGTGLVELVIGSAAIYIFGLRLWDYSGLFLNIKGIVCFRSVVSFAVLGVLFHYLIEPLSKKFYTKIENKKPIYVIALILLIVFVIDCILSAVFRTPITYPDPLV